MKAKLLSPVAFVNGFETALPGTGGQTVLSARIGVEGQAHSGAVTVPEGELSVFHGRQQRRLCTSTLGCN